MADKGKPVVQKEDLKNKDVTADVAIPEEKDDAVV